MLSPWLDKTIPALAQKKKKLNELNVWTYGFNHCMLYGMKWNSCLNGLLRGCTMESAVVSFLSIVCAWLSKSFTFYVPTSGKKKKACEWNAGLWLLAIRCFVCDAFIPSIQYTHRRTLALKLGTEARFCSPIIFITDRNSAMCIAVKKGWGLVFIV